MITVLGSSGFVGAALTRKFREDGWPVTGLARPEFDLTAPATFPQIPGETAVLIHAAAAFPGETPDEELWRVNLLSIAPLVRRIHELPQLQRVIFLSSGAVYGLQSGMITEATPPRPESIYGYSKWFAEQWLATGSKVPTTAVRLFFPFGAGQRPQRLIPRLAARIRGNEPVSLNGEEGGPAMNPIAIDDLGTALSELVTSARSAPVVNLGGEAVVTVRELAETMGDLLGKKPVFRISGESSGNLFCRPRQPSSTMGRFRRQLLDAITPSSHDPVTADPPSAGEPS